MRAYTIEEDRLKRLDLKIAKSGGLVFERINQHHTISYRYGTDDNGRQGFFVTEIIAGEGREFFAFLKRAEARAELDKQLSDTIARIKSGLKTSRRVLAAKTEALKKLRNER